MALAHSPQSFSHEPAREAKNFASPQAPDSPFLSKLQQAQTAFDQCRFQDCMRLAEDVLDNAADKDHHLRGEAYFHIVLVRAKQRCYSDALEASFAALECWHAAGDLAKESKALYLHAHILCHIGQLDTAVHTAYRSLSLAEASKCDIATVRALIAVGVAHLFLGQIAISIEELERAVSLARTTGSLEVQRIAIANMAAAYSAQGTQSLSQSEEEARRWFVRTLEANEEAVEIARQRGIPSELVAALVNFQSTAVTLEQYDRAEVAIEEALAIYRQHPEMSSREVLLNLAVLQANQGRMDLAIETLHEALQVSIEVKDAWSISKCHEVLVDAYQQTGDKKKSLHHFREFDRIQERLRSQAVVEQALVLKVLHQTEHAKEEAEAERLRAEILAHDNTVLHHKAGQLAHEAQTDALTQVSNRRHLDNFLEAVSQERRSVAFLLIDIDHFKQVNDTFSHQVGDAVLKRMGKLLRAGCRRGDLPARYGGEEFAVVLIGMNKEKAARFADRLRQKIARFNWASINPGLKVTVSIGVATTHEESDTVELLALADRRLYCAKREGRNRVVAEDRST